MVKYPLTMTKVYISEIIKTNDIKNFKLKINVNMPMFKWCQTTKPSVIDSTWHHQFLTIKMYFMNYIMICIMSWTEMNAFKSKDKSPEVPFHRITSSYSYFEEFDFLRQFCKKQNMIKKKYHLNRNEKFVDKAQQCFAFLHIKPKFKFAVQWSWFLET